MLMPKKVKFSKQQRGRRARHGQGRRLPRLRRLRAAGARAGLGHRAPDRGGRVAITPPVKRGGKIWIRVFPDKPITKKPPETRMGKGKGAPRSWVARGQAGAHPLRDGGRDRRRWREEAMRLAAHKLGIKTPFVSRHERAEVAAMRSEA